MRTQPCLPVYPIGAYRLIKSKPNRCLVHKTQENSDWREHDKVNNAHDDSRIDPAQNMRDAHPDRVSRRQDLRSDKPWSDQNDSEDRRPGSRLVSSNDRP